MANEWKYECDCRNCANIKFVNDPTHCRYGHYCIPAIEGEKTIHADDDNVVRCNHYCPKATQMSLF